jgi:hypothetical protein
MDDGGSQTWVNTVAGAVLAAVVGFLMRIWGKIDKLEENQGTYVTRTELQEYFRTIRQERVDMHQANSQRLDHIDGSLVRVHTRIDKIYEEDR